VFHLAEQPRCARWVGLTCDVVLWPELPADLKRQFTYIGRFKVDHFEVLRYRSAELVRMRPCRLVANAECVVVFHTDR